MRALLLILFALLSFPAFSSTYTKIANNGADLSDSALLGTGPNDWACTRDNRSGLLWEVKTADGGLRDRYKTYTNYDDPTQPQKMDGSKPTQVEIDAASNSIGLVKAVNAGGLCGQRDWRMPGKDELANLLETSYTPAIDPTFFPNTWASFWSGSPSPVASDSKAAWCVDFRNLYSFVGVCAFRSSAGSYGVRLVRGGQSFVSFALSLSTTGSGYGRINGSTGGIDCPSAAGTPQGNCSANLANGTVVTLTATPGSGNSFTGWSGACGGASTSCTLAMDAAKNVTVAFAVAPSGQYSKIANNGSVLPDSAVLGSGATDWACTRDNQSGLLWEVKTADSGLRDWNKTYTNYDDLTQPQKWNGSTYVNPTQAEIDAASNSTGLVKAVNAVGLCGQSDWRMPGKDELFGLVDRGYNNPMINPSFFLNTNMQNASFWSGSPDVGYSSRAWYVYFGFGYTYDNSRSAGNGVRLVRGAPSVAPFALAVSATGSGSGTLTGSAGGLNCTSTAGTTSGTCTASLASGISVTLTATPAAGNTFTGWGGACSGSSATCTLTMDAEKSVTANFNSAALSSQSIAFGTTPTVVVGGTGTVSATASSGLPVTFSSTTPGICTVSGSTVTGIAAGLCTLAANQAGNSSFSPAAQVTQSFSINEGAAVPDSPTIISITAGSGRTTINFSAPGNTGGSAITAYTASCTASGQSTRTATGATSPLTVKNLSGGVLYQCTLTATNGGGLTGSASAAQPVTPVAGKSGLTPMLMLLLN
jgi:hypothetical protein